MNLPDISNDQLLHMQKTTNVVYTWRKVHDTWANSKTPESFARLCRFETLAREAVKNYIVRWYPT